MQYDTAESPGLPDPEGSPASVIGSYLYAQAHDVDIRPCDKQGGNDTIKSHDYLKTKKYNQ